ncbi:general transcription repressor [Naganishia albida]|nr:general transcription repressor [Naganishia albida]
MSAIYNHHRIPPASLPPASNIQPPPMQVPPGARDGPPRGGAGLDLRPPPPSSSIIPPIPPLASSASDARGPLPAGGREHHHHLHHHHPIPPPPPAGPHGQQQQLAHPGPHAMGHERLNEYLELVRGEYEALQAECMVVKGQRDEFEKQIQAQIQEIALIRQSLYELESQHAKTRNEFEGECIRLRRELDLTRNIPSGPSGGGPGAGGGPLPPPPGIVGGGIGSVPSSMPAPPGAPGIQVMEREREMQEREMMERREREYRGYGKMEVDEKSGMKNGYPSHAATPNPERERTVPLAASQVALKSPGTVLSDLDPESVPREFKKEGAEWFAVWNPRNKKSLDVSLVHTLVHESVVCCVRFSSDGQYLATGCNRTAQIYDTKTGAKTHILVDEAASQAGDLYIRSICFSPDGKYLATGAEDRQIRIWDISKKRIKHLLTGHNQEIYSLDFSRDGQFLVSGSGDKSARIWDINSGHCVFDLKIEDVVLGEAGPIDAGITSVALSPDSKLVAAGSLDTIVRVWDTRTGQQVERLRGHKDSVYSVAFSPDGNSLVSGSLDKSLKVWDLRQTRLASERAQPGHPSPTGLGVLQQTLVGHKDYVLSVGITPDGQWIVSGSKDRSIQFWQGDGQAQFLLQGHKNSVISIDLAKSGNLFASGSGDCHARVWQYTSV